MTDIDHLIREDLPPDIKEKLKFLGKLVPDPRFNAATLSDKKVEVLMDLIKASFDESYGNLIDQIVTITNISRSTLYNYRNAYLEDEKLVSIHILGTEALRASLPIICEFDTLQNR